MNPDRNLLKRIELLVDVLLTLLAFICAYKIKKYLLVDPFGGLSTEYQLFYCTDDGCCHLVCDAGFSE